MAASPRAESASAPAQEKYNVPEEQARDVSMAPPDNEPASGGQRPADDRTPAQGADGADKAPAAPSADGADAASGSQSPADPRGEKQIKVLVCSDTLLSLLGLRAMHHRVPVCSYLSHCVSTSGEVLTVVEWPWSFTDATTILWRGAFLLLVIRLMSSWCKWPARFLLGLLAPSGASLTKLSR